MAVGALLALHRAVGGSIGGIGGHGERYVVVDEGLVVLDVEAMLVSSMPLEVSLPDESTGGMLKIPAASVSLSEALDVKTAVAMVVGVVITLICEGVVREVSEHQQAAEVSPSLSARKPSFSSTSLLRLDRAMCVIAFMMQATDSNSDRCSHYNAMEGSLARS